MPDINVYLKMPLDLLGMIYFYLITQQATSQNWNSFNQQLQMIKHVAKDRGMTLLELQMLGYWCTERERSLVRNESFQPPLTENV